MSATTGHLTRGGAALADAVRELYRAGQTDYSLEPIVLVDAQGKPIGRINDGDAVVFCCRRGEREIQLTEAFAEPGFDHFPRPDFQNLTFVILTLYHEKFKDLPVAFAPVRIKDTLGEIVSRANLRQLRVSESEKFAHVTFFFNGGNHQSFAGEEDVRIPSLKGVPFDQVPELSLAQVTEQVLSGIEKCYDLIVTNFANGDVIGHTQNREAKIKCAELVDAQLGQVVSAALAADMVVLVTADHGNLELMANPDGTPHVAHTTNPVPFILIDPRAQSCIDAPSGARDGKLADIAPTVLHALGVAQPGAMEGASLAREHDWGGPRRVLLVILDGWGIGKNDDTNPISLAQTPVWDDLTRRYPCARLQAAGDAVGLKPGKAGNSEAGHMNIGAGRVVLQDDVRLDLAMKDGSFYTNEILVHTIHAVKQRNANLHLIGLLTEKSSHGSIDYPLALLRMAKASGLCQVYLHMIFDGRSTEPGSAPAMLEKLERQVEEIGVGQIVSGVGRGIALDRDGNYFRTKRAYDALVLGVGKNAPRIKGRLMSASNTSSPDVFSEILYEKIRRINPGVEELELYEFRYALDNLYPKDGGWASVKLEQKEEIEQRINTRDFYAGIQLKPCLDGKIVLDENIVQLTNMLFVGLVTGEYSDEWVRAHFYFDVRGFFFLVRTTYFTDAVLAHFGGQPWKTFEQKQKRFEKFQGIGYKDFRDANAEVDHVFIESVIKLVAAKGAPILLTIAGPTAAGKTEIVARLRSAFEQIGKKATTIEMDNLLLDNDYRDEMGIKSLGKEAYHFELFMQGLQAITQGEKITIPRYDSAISSHDLNGNLKPGFTPLEVEPSDIIFLEGNFPFQSKDVADLIGIKIVYLTDDPIRLKRKWKRDIDYRKKYDPNYFRNRFFRTQFLRAQDCYQAQMQVCDMVVDTTGAAIWVTPEIAKIR